MRVLLRDQCQTELGGIARIVEVSFEFVRNGICVNFKLIWQYYAWISVWPMVIFVV